jgi:hypothetical protein
MKKDSLPSFLQDYGSFYEHLTDELGGKSTVEKGDTFESFAMKVLPLCEEWDEFDRPESREKHSYDEGIDFTAEHESEKLLAAGQSKLKIPSVRDLDSIISKFQQFESKAGANSEGQLAFALNTSEKEIHYYIITSSQTERIEEKYQKSSLASKGFYDKLKEEGRINVIGGRRIFLELQSYYMKTFDIPQSINLELNSNYIKDDDVYLAIVSAEKVKDMYQEHGPSLFFENIRDFLGIDNKSKDRETGVNYEIMQTLRNNPEMMLSRNNGLTFKAEKVKEKEKDELILEKAGIVNGCQTTMCIVKSKLKSRSAKIPIKIVTSGESWEVAKSANYQNEVTRIDLDLARYLRPQLIQKVASDIGYAVEEGSNGSVTSVLNEIHDRQFRYDEVKNLFIGIFSRTPNNLFRYNYNKLRIGLLDDIKRGGSHNRVLEVLLKLVQATQEADNHVRERYEDTEYADLFSRFYNPSKTKYRSFFSILASCACTNTNLEGIEENESGESISEFIDDVERVIVSDRDIFRRSYVLTFKAVAQGLLTDTTKTESEIRKDITSRVRDSNFTNLYRQVRLELDSDPLIDEMKQS